MICTFVSLVSGTWAFNLRKLRKPSPLYFFNQGNKTPPPLAFLKNIYIYVGSTTKSPVTIAPMTKSPREKFTCDKIPPAKIPKFYESQKLRMTKSPVTKSPVTKSENRWFWGNIKTFAPLIKSWLRHWLGAFVTGGFCHGGFWPSTIYVIKVDQFLFSF